VRCPDGRSLEIQIRTWDMHKHAELGVAAHWRYKEGSKRSAEDDYDEKIAWLRSCCPGRTKSPTARLGQAVQARLARRHALRAHAAGQGGRPAAGATPVDFAYRVHTDLGHRCRGAKVDGQLVPLNTPLETGQTVEIVTAKEGGPSRDWLNPALGYIHTKSARVKVRGLVLQPGAGRNAGRRPRHDRQGIAARRADQRQHRGTGAQAGLCQGR
jgi:GTP pyrophosphokinase